MKKAWRREVGLGTRVDRRSDGEVADRIQLETGRLLERYRANSGKHQTQWQAAMAGAEFVIRGAKRANNAFYISGPCMLTSAGGHDSMKQIDKDVHIVGLLHEIHDSEYTRKGKWNQGLSGAIGTYLFGYYRLHPLNIFRPGKQCPSVDDDHWRILPIQIIALAIWFEGVGCDIDAWTARQALRKRLRSFPEVLDWTSEPMQQITNRTWTSSGLVQEFRELVAAEGPNG